MNEPAEILDPRERRLHEVVGAYLEAADAGWAPDRDQLLERYPDLADELAAFFVAQARVAALAYPCPSDAQRRDKGAGGASLSNSPTEDGWPRLQDAGARALSDYESLALIKEGGMGSVFKAWQRGAKRWVALKKIKAGRLATGGEVRRFRDEAEAAANLDHPNIVPIYEVGMRDGQPFFSMKLFENGSLQDHLPRFQNDPPAAARLLAAVARAVHHAHQHGILHRDLKPANILLDAQEQPYVADFGLAKRLGPRAQAFPPAGDADQSPAKFPGARSAMPSTERSAKTDVATASDFDDVSYLAPEQARKTQRFDESSDDELATANTPSVNMTREGTLVGTYGYMPPEHAGTSKDGTSTAADIYSLGAILYKLLTGKTVFQAQTLNDTVRQIRECTPASPRASNPRVDARLEAVCLKCLEKDPKRRYASAEALAEDLDRWLKGEPPLAWRMPWRLRAWRAVRRYLLVGTLTAVLGFGTAALFFALYYYDPDRVPRGLEAHAKESRLVLIGETGSPKWSRWVDGDATAIIRSGPDEAFSFATLEIARLELLAKAPAPRYRFAAEIRHDRAAGQGNVGVYFARTQRIQENEIQRSWCDLSFADLGISARVPNPFAKKKEDRAARFGKFELTLERGAPHRHRLSLATESNLFFESAEAKQKLPDWRRVDVEVNPEKVQISFAGQPLKNYSRAKLGKLSEGLKIGEQMVFPEFDFDPAGGLGVFVEGGKASFRNVTIEPLK